MRHAQKCPLCEGFGNKGPQLDAASGKCLTCNGSGLLWSGYDSYPIPCQPVITNPSAPSPYWPYWLPQVWCGDPRFTSTNGASDAADPKH